MSVSRRKNRHWIKARQAISLVLLLVLCAAHIPLPATPSERPEKDQTIPFPCQNRPCGCNTAEQCWKSCCCFSHIEKLAWAKLHAPESLYSVEAVSDPQCMVASQLFADTENAAITVVATVTRSSCCARAAPAHITTSVDTGACCSQQRPSQQNPNSQAACIIGLLKLECQGQGWVWHVLSTCVLPTPWQVPDRLPVVIEAWPWTNAEAPVVCRQPPVPPPRQCVAA